jgi:hypothetical protein
MGLLAPGMGLLAPGAGAAPPGIGEPVWARAGADKRREKEIGSKEYLFIRFIQTPDLYQDHLT